MALAIFDLDNTLIGGDSDHAWGDYLVEQKVVDPSVYREANDRFHDQYQNGTLDILEYLAFALEPLTQHPTETLHALRERFLAEQIEPLMLPAAAALLDQHRQRGDVLLIITATNRFVTEPIAALLKVDHLLATDPEIKDGRYTGRVAGTPCFQGGKVERLHQWLKQTSHTLDDAWFYSDSHNDLPLLEAVPHPVAIDPDPILEDMARQRGWPIRSLRG
ncbi:HAD family hydrolase [Hydrocarboniclastica marina]|uniref:Histidinol-phosphatase n=1 Tax=Hydrocarboniclastica marina TaxID=2259620 RepID=A0A4V1D8G0_9ALTE|nr:HAD family phosphatase [Hydrocarboniclastica marina]QCF25060.1 HAD-IB family hydrolase [Hydrocarboniclastica marina]